MVTILAHPLDKITHSKTHLGPSMFSGRASLGPSARRTYSIRETPALSDRERYLKSVGQKKEGMRKNKGKGKSSV